MNYYNEIDPFAAQWLRNLIKAGNIPDGYVDERSIVDVDPADLRPFRQCHFFAGIAGWPYALQLAGWPDDFAVWTGSCPCQPLSSAGLHKGHADARHLWPAFYHLIAELQPSVVFGEQVAGTLGREWFSAVRADLEGVGYACGAADLCAAGVGAPHIRQRLYWVADANQGQRRWVTDGERRQRDWQAPRWVESDGEFERGGETFVACRDGKRRPIEPGTFPLADGISSRVGRLRAYGNAIVPQLAAEMIGAYRDQRQG